MAIAVEKLLKIYKTKKGAYHCALKDLTFNLPDKGMVFILGKSGCGKSTLLNLLGGLDGFDGGDIKVDGKSISGYKAKELDRYRNDYVGFVFQENNLLEKESVKSNVALSLDLQGIKDTDGKVESALESVGLKEFAERSCNRLSGGQKQRVAIARALIKQPKMLLCDEPTGALDSETGAEIFTLLKEVSKERLVVVVSHDGESAEQYGDRVIELKDGEIVSDSAPLNEADVTEQTKTKHGGLRFVRAFKLGARYVIARPIRMVICLLVCFLAFSFAGAADVLSAYDRDTALMYTMDETGTKFYAFGKADIKGYRKFSVSVPEMTLTEAGELSSLISADRIDYIYTLQHRAYYVYLKEVTVSLFDDDTANDNYLLQNACVKGFVEADTDFINDYGFSLVAGRLPENTDEIALPLYLYNFFQTYGYFGEDEEFAVNSYDDLIGKTVSLKNGTPLPPPKTVTGIIDTNFVYKKQADVLFGGEPEYFKMEEDLRAIETDIMHNSMFVCKGFNDYYSENNFGQNRGDNIVARVIAPYKGSSAQKLKNIRIYQTQFDGKSVSKDSGNCYHLVNYSAEQLWRIESDNAFIRIQNLSVYFSIGMVLLSALFVIFYASGTIQEKRREIGILRALGTSRADMLKINACEYGIFTVITVAVSTVVCSVLSAIIDESFTKNVGFGTVLIKFSIRQFAIIAAVAVLAVVVGVAVPLIKLLIKKPVDVIADRK